MCCFRIEYLWVRKNIRLATNSSLLTQTNFQLSLVKPEIGLRSQATQTGVLFKISVPPQRVENGDIWFLTERDWSQEGFPHNDTKGVTLFLLWCAFLVPLASLKNTAQIFLEIFLIQYFTVLAKQFMTSPLSSFALYKNINISKTKKDTPKKKTPFFFILKGLSKNKQLFFTSIL